MSLTRLPKLCGLIIRVNKINLLNCPTAPPPHCPFHSIATLDTTIQAKLAQELLDTIPGYSCQKREVVKSMFALRDDTMVGYVGWWVRWMVRRKKGERDEAVVLREMINTEKQIPQGKYWNMTEMRRTPR